MLIADKFFNRNFSKSECQNPYQAHIRDQAEIKKQKHCAASIRTASDLHFSLQFAFFYRLMCFEHRPKLTQKETFLVYNFQMNGKHI